MDPVIILLKEKGLPLTRENYIALNWGEVPQPWTVELEQELPEELQDMSQFSHNSYTDQ